LGIGTGIIRILQPCSAALRVGLEYSRSGGIRKSEMSKMLTINPSFAMKDHDVLKGILECSVQSAVT
jgi:hypothetical protein